MSDQLTSVNRKSSQDRTKESKKEKKRAKKISTEILPPQNEDELFALETQLNEVLREYEKEETRLKSSLLAIRKDYEERMLRHERRATRIASMLKEYVELHLSELTQGKRKSIQHTAASFSWTDPMQIVTNLKDRIIVERLLNKKRLDLLIPKYSPNRTKLQQALLELTKSGKKKFALRGVHAKRVRYLSISAHGVRRNARYNYTSKKWELVVPRSTQQVAEEE